MESELDPFVGFLLRLATYLHILFMTDSQNFPQNLRKHCSIELLIVPRSYHLADSLMCTLS